MIVLCTGNIPVVVSLSHPLHVLSHFSINLEHKLTRNISWHCCIVNWLRLFAHRSFVFAVPDCDDEVRTTADTDATTTVQSRSIYGLLLVIVTYNYQTITPT